MLMAGEKKIKAAKQQFAANAFVRQYTFSIFKPDIWYKILSCYYPVLSWWMPRAYPFLVEVFITAN